MNIQDVISKSQATDSIVHLDAANIADLLVECDDSVENDEVYEFWGADWRIHVRMDGALDPIETSEGWVVDCRAGGRWIPTEDAQSEIQAAEDSAARAFEICAWTPSRGTWKQ